MAEIHVVSPAIVFTTIVVNVRRCTRCRQDHENLTFQPMRNPAEFTHHGVCPVTNEPIIMRAVEAK
jgi:hypothetical protein